MKSHSERNIENFRLCLIVIIKTKTIVKTHKGKLSWVRSACELPLQLPHQLHLLPHEFLPAICPHSRCHEGMTQQLTSRRTLNLSAYYSFYHIKFPHIFNIKKLTILINNSNKINLLPCSELNRKYLPLKIQNLSEKRFQSHFTTNKNNYFIKFTSCADFFKQQATKSLKESEKSPSNFGGGDWK